MNKPLIIALSVLSITACSIVPEPIQIADNTPLVPFSQIINSPQAQAAVGEKARWGGRIVSVENKQEASEIEVIFFPAGLNGKPRTGEESEGRFKAIVPGFVDPLVFEKDRLITIVGNVSEPATGIIGEQAYTYPTLNAVGYYMWKQSSDLEVRNVGYQPFFFGSPFYRMGWSSWYDPWGPSFHRSRVRVIEHNGHSQGSRVERSGTPTGSATSAGSNPRFENTVHK